MQIVMPMEYAADVSPAYAGMAAREHAMSAPGGDTHGDRGGRSRYGVPHSAAKRDGCATIGIGGATHGDGAGEPSSGADRSTAKRDGCATTGIGGATHGDGAGEPSRGVDRSAAEPIDRNRS
jgi:hypothetical protein